MADEGIKELREKLRAVHQQRKEALERLAIVNSQFRAEFVPSAPKRPRDTPQSYVASEACELPPREREDPPERPTDRDRDGSPVRKSAARTTEQHGRHRATLKSEVIGGNTTTTTTATATATAADDERKNVGSDQMKARARRMFGVMMGTLQRFSRDSAAEAEAKATKAREEALNEASAKVEEMRSSLQREEMEKLTALRAERTAQVELLEREERETERKLKALRHAIDRTARERFRKTKAKPEIFWAPKELMEEIATLDAPAVTIKDEDYEKDEETEESVGPDVGGAEKEANSTTPSEHEQPKVEVDADA